MPTILIQDDIRLTLNVSMPKISASTHVKHGISGCQTPAFAAVVKYRPRMNSSWLPNTPVNPRATSNGMCLRCGVVAGSNMRACVKMKRNAIHKPTTTTTTTYSNEQNRKCENVAQQTEKTRRSNEKKTKNKKKTHTHLKIKGLTLLEWPEPWANFLSTMEYPANAICTIAQTWKKKKN